MKLDKSHAHQFIISLAVGFGIVIIVYASFNLYRSLTVYQVETMMIRAQEAEQAGNLEEALRIRTTIQKTIPDDTENTLMLARLYLALNNYPEAETYAKLYSEKSPQSIDGYMLQGAIQLKLGDTDAARQSFTSAYENNKSREAAYYLALIAMGAKEDPLPYLEAAASTPEPYQGSSELLTAWQNAQSERNPIYKDALIAFHLLEVDQPHIALLLLEQVLVDEPEYRDGYYLRGVALAETGDLSGAVDSLNSALEIDPEHQASIDALTAIQDKLGEIQTPTPDQQ